MDEIAPDGSPVLFYLRLPAGPTPELIDGAVAPRASILELGCGVGRITHPLVALGHEVVAVDNSKEMLRHVRGVRTVLADIEALQLDQRFDAVVLASHLINCCDRDQRRRLFEVCARHVRDDGVVLIERYEPQWTRSADTEMHQVGDVAITWHDVHRDGDLLHATVTYEVDGRSWTQQFAAAILDDDQFRAEAEEAGLSIDAWIGPRREWARLVTRGKRIRP